MAVLAVTGVVVPAASAAQDTVSTPERGWFGVRFISPESLFGPVPRRSVQLVVADVYRNSPADVEGILPGDWFISVDGSPLATYEYWLRSTSNLHAGKSIRVVVVRGGEQHEVTLIADPAPPFVAPNPLDDREVVMARLDSAFVTLMGMSPAATPQPWHMLPDFGLYGAFEFDSAGWTVTLGDSAAAPGGEVLTQRTGGGEMTITLQGQSHMEAGPPPAVGGGGTEIPEPDPGLGEFRPSILDIRLIESPLLFGGVEVRDLTAELGRDYFGVEKGVLVTNVIVGPGLEAGFRPGDVIVSAEGKAFETVREFRQLLAKLSTPIELTVVRDKESLKIVYPRPER